MVRLSSEKFSIAWFKLAEFVVRKERERVFVLYRLLIHSLQDHALIAQLEGDLLASFKDEKAVHSYRRAIQYYENVEKWAQAIFVCERILSMIKDVSSEQYREVAEKLAQYRLFLKKKPIIFIPLIAKTTNQHCRVKSPSISSATFEL